MDESEARVPDDIAGAMAKIHEEDAWLHADDLLDWMIHAAKSEMSDPGGAEPISLMPDSDGRGMIMRFARSERHGEREVRMTPMLDDVTNVLYGFTFSADGRKPGSDIIMPDDIIKSVPHGARRPDGSYGFDPIGFAGRMDRVIAGRRKDRGE